MGERGAAHREVVVLEQQRALLGCIPDPVDSERIADPGGAGAQHTIEITLQRVRPVEIHPCGAAAGEPEAGEQTRQAEHVVAVHVGDEHPPQLRQPQITA